MQNVRIRSYRSIDDLESCNRFLEGHSEVLKVYGVTQVTSAKKDWFNNPNVYVIVAESKDTGRLLGGARVQVADELQPLPIIKAVEDIDASIHHLIDKYKTNGTGELCGLWVSREVAGKGISFLLIKAAIAILDQLHLKSLFALCSPFTLSMFLKVGYIVEESVGNKGTFYYPKEDLIATAVILKNLDALSKAEAEVRREIQRLRKSPRQQCVENEILNIEYDLVIHKQKEFLS